MNRRYVQFNDLIIDDSEMLSSADLSGGFKTQSISYGFGHGSYVAFKRETQFSTAQSLSIELKFNNRKHRGIASEQYRAFIAHNLARPGRLWAVQGNTVLWAWAFATNFGEAYSYERQTFSMDVDFTLYEGVWHKADKRRVFLKPYDSCEYLDGFDLRDADNCDDCCTACMAKTEAPCPVCLAGCDFLSAEHSLCEADKATLDEFYGHCGGGYSLAYNCFAGSRIWGCETMLGQKLCKADTCNSLIAGTLYSDTTLETDGVTVTLDGVFYNPTITINGNSMRILGEYDGRLIIEPSGSIYFQTSECCAAEPLDLDLLEIPDGSHFGFTAHHGSNSVVVETNNCCDMACIYIHVDSITI